MPGLYAGSSSILMLLASALLSPWPTLPGAALFLGLGALWLEGGGFDLDAERSNRFSPAVPVYLAMAMVPGLGAGLAGLFLILDAAYRMERGFMRNLAQRAPLATALLAACGWNALPSAPLWALYVLCPTVFLLAHWTLRKPNPATAEDQLLAQRQLQFRIRPLEVGLAAAAPLIAAAVSVHAALFLAAIPLLACTHLAAENVLLSANDQTIAGVLEKLRGAQDQARKAAQQRDKALQEKQLLEGFSQHLASHPDLEAVASNLVATVHNLMAVDSVVVFLGNPPEPFSYSVSLSQQAVLQGVALTALREPLVDRAFEQKKPVLQKKPPEVAERLLREDRTAAALPMGITGVLYVGRHSEQGFVQPELERLKWLSGKAAIALEAAYQIHEQARARRLQEQTVHRLERKVAWLSQLVQGAEAMSSSLQGEILVQRFTTSIGQTVTHSGGQLLLEGRPSTAWGVELRPHPELLETARGTSRPLVIEDTSTSRFGAPGPGVASLVIAPLLARQKCTGILVLASDKKAAFSGEQVDLLFLLCSQAAMALSHSGLYSQVVEAREQLERSQASLVQSSKLTAIGQLAAGVAHELNTPLGAISLSVGEALNQFSERPELAQKLMNRAQQAVDRAKAIVNRLMAYSRKPENQLQTLSLQDVVRETVEFLAFQLRTAGVTTTIEASDITLVEGEEQPLQQVVTNLVLNAAQAMEETEPGTRRLAISLIPEDGQIRLDIADTGSGIEAENLERIFDPFFTTKPVGRGTGLGLWACQQIVIQHGGTVSVKSRPGQGTVFTVMLPAAKPL